MNEPSNTDAAGISRARWTRLTIIALAICALVVALKTCDNTKKGIDVGKKVIEKLPEIAEKFKTGTITNTFISRTTEVASTSGDVLEIATTRNDETFRREDAKSIFWNWVYLGKTVSEIRAPSTFRYHIRLSDTWRLAARDNVCVVLAPRIRASLPPAIHTQQMEKLTESGWARFNKSENLAELERGITPELEKRATDDMHIRLAREACRQSVAEFVKKWLMKEDQWRQDHFSSILVVFPDEKQFESDAELEQCTYEPTIKL